jgi:hypothetical protein
MVVAKWHVRRTSGAPKALAVALSFCCLLGLGCPKQAFGSFSTQQAARDFISQQSVNGNYATYPVRKQSKQLYNVLYGYYSTRLRAENSSKQFKALKVWIRSFKDIK